MMMMMVMMMTQTTVKHCFSGHFSMNKLGRIMALVSVSLFTKDFESEKNLTGSLT